MKGLGPAFSPLGSIPYPLAANYSPKVVPLFILMDHFAYHSETGNDPYRSAYRWLGGPPSGFSFNNLPDLEHTQVRRWDPPEQRTLWVFRRQLSFALSTIIECCHWYRGTLGAVILSSDASIIYGIISESS